MISKIDEVFTQQLEQLNQEILSLKFEENFTFELSENFDSNLLSSISFMGVYLVEIQVDDLNLPITNWLSQFIEKWEHKDFKNNFVPNSRKGRVAKHINNTEWIPLYLGKSKNISARIHEHIYKKMHIPSGGLKLLARQNIYGTKFRISTIPLNVKNYDLILPQVEKHFRESINPILGKQ